MSLGDPSRPRLGPDEGELSVFVADEQQDHPVDVERWARLAEQVLGAEGVRGEAEVSVLFVDEAEMAELNRRYMDKPGPTDVLSFPLDLPVDPTPRSALNAGPPAFDDDQPLLLGDVVICPAVAARNAPDHAGSFDDEVALLLVHGLLHLLGHDHAEDDQRAAMWGRERDLLGRFHGELARDPWAVEPS